MELSLPNSVGIDYSVSCIAHSLLFVLAILFNSFNASQRRLQGPPSSMSRLTASVLPAKPVLPHE